MTIVQKAIGKSITYRIGAVLLTFVLTYWLTGKGVESVAFSLVVELIHSVWYFLHELLWERKWKSK